MHLGVYVSDLNNLRNAHFCYVKMQINQVPLCVYVYAHVVLCREGVKHALNNIYWSMLSSYVDENERIASNKRWE